MRGTIVLVAHGDEASIRPVLAEIDEAAHQLARSDVSLRIVLVDAGGGATAEAAADEAGRLGLDVDLVRDGTVHQDDDGTWHSHLLGFTRAMEGAAPAHRPDFLVTLDAAGHHDARQLPDLVRAFLARGSGMTIGSRWVRGGSAPGTPPVRALLSRLASALVGRMTGLRRVRDVTTSFRVMRPEVAALVADEHSTVGTYGYYCESVAVAQALGFSIDEVPITFRPRYSGVGELTNRDLVRFWRDVRRIRERVRGIRRAMAHDQATWAERSGRHRAQAGAAGSHFGAVDELWTLAGATRFVDWIVSELDPYLHGRILEVGAGLGTVAAEIARRHSDASVTAIEPADNVIDRLTTCSAGVENLDVRQCTSAELLADGSDSSFDVVVYVNVLEHIRDDVAELRIAHRLLAPGGQVCVFGPAMPSLYGSLDFKSGHYRRYDAGSLCATIEAAGFDVVELHHLDVAGVVPYWLMYRLLDVDRLDRVSSSAYDRVVVPVSRTLQRAVRRPPIGKNLVAVARRGEASTR
jgi:2-polyprenyl-3-methyl-5-hydroxy-6-metoxy-1,4-benzoquinol methylase